MACGVPPISTDVGDAVRLMGDAGVAIPSRDAAALLAACSRLLDMSTEERSSLGKACRQRVIDQFSMQSMIGHFQSLFTSNTDSSISQSL